MYKNIITKRHIVMVAILFLMLINIPLSFAQQEAADIPLETTSEEKKAASGNVTLDFKEADIHNVLRILSYKSGTNIVAGKEVKGTVTIRLVDVPWEKALDVVLKTYGFAYERDDNIIRVTTVEQLGEEPLKTEVFALSYAKAEEVSESIKEMVTDRGNVKYDKRSNMIIVTDVPTNIHKIGGVIERLDERTPQVYIEAKIIETILDDDEQLGINWDISVTAKGSTIPHTMPFDRTFDHMEDWARRRVPLGDDADTFPSVTRPLFPYAAVTDFTFGTLSFNSFQAVLSVLNERSDTKIISNPRLVTMNNQEATIHIGETIYIPEYTESPTTGSPVFTGLEKSELDTGIKLKVTPHVNSKQEIVVDLEPEVSSLGTKTALLTTSAGENVYAWPVSIRSAKTQIMVADGETIAIGGLLKEQTVKSVDKVPFLGDIPILGYLFKHETETTDTRDLLIFVTVKLIGDKKDTEVSFEDISERIEETEEILSP